MLLLHSTPEVFMTTLRKPSWLKTPIAHGDVLVSIKRKLRKGQLHTVCEEAKCPNIAECLNAGTATFMILGDTCTRGCRFCNVKTGNPGGVLDAEEPQKVAETIRDMGLDYAVLTMVDRDDLPDGGAEHIAKTVSAIRELSPNIIIEILAGDFRGNQDALRTVLFSGNGLNTFAHNLETVRRLSSRVRDAKASYEQSLDVLRNAKSIRPESYSKSGIMLGLGEEHADIEECLRDMRSAGVQIVTIGQYLQPTPRHLPVVRFAHPEEFDHWKTFAESIGFLAVASGPLVRSSYRAANLFPRKGGCCS
jgi:lipoic acid synthetase